MQSDLNDESRDDGRRQVDSGVDSGSATDGVRFIMNNRGMVGALAVALLSLVSNAVQSVPLNISNRPLAVGSQEVPLAMIVLGKNHRLYYEAYNDASDLDGDGELDIRFSPEREYFGYFDSGKCYDYSSGVFVPRFATSDHIFMGRPNRYTCRGSGLWSGNFLNYLTTSRMDALRKVLYGGTRRIDSATRTVLERAYIPQDAHSWGKEYNSVAIDQYQISDYSPLSVPSLGKRHLFANVTLLAGSGDPLMRVMTNVDWRVWEWLSKERPVAGDECQRGVTRTPCMGSPWMPIAAGAFVPGTLRVSYYDLDNVNNDDPTNAAAFQALVTSNAIPDRLCGSHQPSQTSGSAATHPFLGVVTPAGEPCQNNNYMTLYEGTIRFEENTAVDFTLDGSDAVEILVNGAPVVGWYGGHNATGGPNPAAHQGSYTFLANTDYQLSLRHEQDTGNSQHAFYWRFGENAARTDYVVRVEVCNPSLLEDNCHEYGNGTGIFKPVGLLHEYGESQRIKFGLLTGSFTNNTEGGVLRKNVSFFSDEVNPNTGRFTPVNGIVKTIDALRIIDFGGNYVHNNCANPFTAPIQNGQCSNWGNPIAEMMYETMRYFSGARQPTGRFDYSGGSRDQNLGLPKPAWVDPYQENPECAKPVQLVMSDANPDYDTNSLPGSVFAAGFSGNQPVAGFNAARSADEVYGMEYGGTRQFYVGESNGTGDFAPTPKSVSNFSTLRGLAPEDPSKFGGYYGAGVAWFGNKNDLHPTASGHQKMETFAVAIASPLPTFRIPVGTGVITLIPFAKSVGGGGIGNPNVGWIPTNQIVDFYVEEITPTYGKFRVNFEDVEHGNDHDMDAIAEYEFNVVGGNLEVIVNSTYALGGITQHMGYVISGTNGTDGTYLVVRDLDTGAGADAGMDYFLDTPPGVGPNHGGPFNNTGWDDNAALPLISTRTFSPGSVPAAQSLKNPLWYAAKYGSFNDEDGDGTPRNSTLGDAEWDEDGDGDPDNYFLVTNALGLSAELSRAFQEIVDRASAAAAVAINTGRLSADSLVFQARFDPNGWKGELRAFRLDANGIPAVNPEWEAGSLLQTMAVGNRNIITYNPVSARGVPFRWPANAAAPTEDEMALAQIAAIINTYGGGDVDDYGSDIVGYIRGLSPSALNRPLRERESRLGDIVNSDPLYVAGPGRGFPDEWGSGAPENARPYSVFKSTYRNRTPVLYVGANDGMLHAFKATASGDSSDGQELLGYVPTPVFSNLHKYAQLDYTDQRHSFFVDGSPKVDDVFINGNWRTILVGGLAAGGQGYYALDITDPNRFLESEARNLVMWEFTDANDADLGYSFAEPAIGRMQDARWVVVVGNGYNANQFDPNTSATGNGVLFILDARDGSIIKKFDTLKGSEDDPLAQARGNGLTSAKLVDLDSDAVADYIYAGDLFGNLWKIDVTSTNPNEWDFSNFNGSEPQPFYTALDPAGVAQPITIPLEIGPHPFGEGHVLITFGTGKFFESGDNTSLNQQTQTIYGLWDDLSGTALNPGRSTLLRQTNIAEMQFDPGNGADPIQVRVTSDNTIDWTTQRGWYMDLTAPNNPANNRGERVVRKLVMRHGRLIVTTLQPSADICHAGGGSGWLMELIAASGSRLSISPFDINKDGVYSTADFVDVPGVGPVAISGLQPRSGIPSPPAVLSRGSDEIKLYGVSSGTIENIAESVDPDAVGRQTWRRVR